MINWKTTKEENKMINKIVDRFFTFEELKNSNIPRTVVMMDLTACHLNGCPLKLEELLNADDFNFIHDVFGIGDNIDRDTGKLKNHFLPRFSK